MEVEGETLRGALAITRDVSERGILIATSERGAIGSDVHVRCKLPDGQEVEVEGVIVRQETSAEDPRGMWRYQIAVEFDQPVPELASALDALVASGQAKRVESELP